MKRLLFAFVVFPFLTFADTPTKEISREQILSEWREGYERYQPDPAQLEVLKAKLEEGIRIDIYLGLWCPDSKNNVPPFLRLLDAADTAVPVRYFSVQRKPVREIRYFVDSVKVERVPTFIFYRDDIEIGRIVENPQTGIIEDTIAVLSR